MPRTQYLQTNFSAGALSPKVRGRTDLDRYNNGAKLLHNCYPVVQGGVKRRPGTRYVSSVLAAVVADILCEDAYGVDYYTEFLDSFNTDGNLNGASAETSPGSSWTYSGTSSVRSTGAVAPATFTASGDQVAMYKALVSVNMASGETLTMDFNGAGYTLRVVLELGTDEACSFSYVNPDPDYGETITDTFSIGATAGEVTIGFDANRTSVGPDYEMYLYLAPDLVTTPAATIVQVNNSFPSGYTQLSSFEFESTGPNTSVNFIRVCGYVAP